MAALWLSRQTSIRQAPPVTASALAAGAGPGVNMTQWHGRRNDDESRAVQAAEGDVLQLANSETGVLQSLPEGLAVSDMTQAFGKIRSRLTGLASRWR